MKHFQLSIAVRLWLVISLLGYLNLVLNQPGLAS